MAHALETATTPPDATVSPQTTCPYPTEPKLALSQTMPSQRTSLHSEDDDIRAAIR